MTMQLSEPIRGSRDESQTAEEFLSLGQRVFAAIITLSVVAIGLLFGITALLQVFAIVVTAFYAVFVVAKLVVAAAGAGYTFPDLNIPSVHDMALPTYSILVPMRAESEAGFHKLLNSLRALHYPVGRLQVLFLIDEDDHPTLEMVRRQQLPDYMQIVVVPDVGPRTKPKACNYAMLFATGDMTVIFDFEDRPEPDELLKAVAAMNYERFLNPDVACVQATLQFWNPRSGIAGVFYWAEYVVHFRLMLAGMARLGIIPPLGGTSNHFKTSALEAVAKEYGSKRYTHDGRRVTLPNVWDMYNVTEDADLGARLRRCGYLIKMLDAITFEEAPNTLKKAAGQKSRWIKGYLQTWLVQTRRPFRSMREMGVAPYIMYNLFIGGTPFSLLLNPIVWTTTLLYVVSRIAGWSAVSLYIEGLFPPPVYYTAMFVAVVGNAVLLYQQLLTVVRQQEHESFVYLSTGMQNQQFGLTLRLLFLPLWWIFTTVPAYKGVFELLNPRKRYYWNKTVHSHAVHQEAGILGVAAPAHQPAALPSPPGAPWTGARHTGEQDRVN